MTDCKTCIIHDTCTAAPGDSLCQLAYQRKQPNYEAKHDQGKTPLTLVPRKIIWAIGKVRQYGTEKYKDPENWRSVEIERYRDAAFRHFLAYLDDPTGNDEESGLPHLWHLATNISFLTELEDLQ